MRNSIKFFQNIYDQLQFLTIKILNLLIHRAKFNLHS